MSPIAPEGFIDQEMYVFRHQHISLDAGIVAGAGTLQDFFYGGFRGGIGELWAATMTTEGDEVVVARLLVPF